jgi:hypothetical protein
MKILKVLFAILTLLPGLSLVSADDFDWLRDLNMRAEADLSEFRARLETRFKVGDLKIRTILGNIEKPADAYILLRIGEMTDQPIDRIIEKYKADRSKGWGAIARSLGIKPGSKDFNALKQGQDLYKIEFQGICDEPGKGQSKEKVKVKEKSKGKKYTERQKYLYMILRRHFYINPF